MSLSEMWNMQRFKDYTLKITAMSLRGQWVNIQLSTLAQLYIRLSMHGLAHHLYGANWGGFMYNATYVYVNIIFVEQGMTLPINSLRPGDAYMRQITNHQWFR